jgi:hypothetical protein
MIQRKHLPILKVIFLLFIAMPQMVHSATSLKVYMKDEGYGETNIIKPRIYIQNTGTESVSDFVCYYYLTADSGKIPIVETYYIPYSTVTLERLDSGSYRVKYNFSGYTLKAGSVVPDANGNAIGIHYSDWSTINKVNDFSYIASSTFIEDTKIPVYSFSGTLLYGSDAGTGNTNPAVIPVVSVGDPPLVSQYVIYGIDQCIISDRDTIRGGMTGSKGYTEVGCDAIINGNLSSSGNAFLRERATINGSIILGGTLTQQNQVTITGTITQNSSLVYPVISTNTVVAGTQDITVQNNNSLLLNPGSYGNVHVYANATLTLGKGTYNVSSFVLEPGVTLIIAANKSDIVQVNVSNLLSFGDRTIMQFSGTAWALNVRFYSNQTSQFRTGTDSRIYGMITVPYAEIDVPSRTAFVGELYGKQVRVEPDVTICRPAVLMDFWLSEWTYTPAFDPNVLSYSSVVSTDATQVTVTATCADADATATIEGQSSPATITLGNAETLFGIDVSNNSQCGGTHYNVNVKKQPDFMVYVNDNSPASASQCDGTSWYKAYKDLQKGIDSAAKSGKEVWVAEGIYKPTRKTDTSDSRSATFYIQPGEEIIGGFLGAETTADPLGSAYNTILSGDIPGNDTLLTAWPPVKDTDLTRIKDNVYHVVTINGSQATTSIELQGFKITGGVADGDGSKGIGAGLYSVRSSPTIILCVFDHNYSLSNGAGVYSGVGPALVKNCLFRLNYSKAGSGAGLFATSGKSTVNASVFDGNIAAGTSSNGGAIYLKHTTLTMVNSVLTGNSCVNDGGAMYCDSATAAITNCTFYANSASTLGGGITSIGSTVAIINTILWHDNGGSVSCNGSSGCFVDLKGTGFSVSYSCVTGGYTGTGNISGDPLFRTPANPAGDNGKYGSDDDGLQLSSTSPCLDKGTTINAPEEDIMSTEKPTGDGIEMGAYEYVNVAESNKLPFGRLVNGEFIGTNDLDRIMQIIHPFEILHYSKSKCHRVLRLHVTNKKETRNASEMTAYITPVNADGSTAASEIAVRLKKIGKDDNGQLLFQSMTSDYSWGKKILFTADKYWHGCKNSLAYVIYLPVDGKLNFRIPHDQF